MARRSLSEGILLLLLPMAKDSTDGETNDAMRREGGRKEGVFMWLYDVRLTLYFS